MSCTSDSQPYQPEWVTDSQVAFGAPPIVYRPRALEHRLLREANQRAAAALERETKSLGISFGSPEPRRIAVLILFRHGPLDGKIALRLVSPADQMEPVRYFGPNGVYQMPGLGAQAPAHPYSVYYDWYPDPPPPVYDLPYTFLEPHPVSATASAFYPASGSYDYKTKWLHVPPSTGTCPSTFIVGPPVQTY